ncbi:STU1 [[Candida] subhashii]|uniref:STU1 n=1 Tax=[Candida] subhashii TaxID=561895 RepID=A0A8J5QKX3_9ASCO|nr:STU1 [[Candida] subhashii]KAG7662333.1 STU1 [[Candida] subhashii]
MSATRPPSGDEFLQTVLSTDVDDSFKIDSLQKLKAHIKRDKIDLAPVPKYMEALVVTIKDGNHQISSLGLTTLSYLIKRVGVQDVQDQLLKVHSNLVVPALITSLGDTNPNIVSIAKRALETYWLGARKEVEAVIAREAFSSHDSNVTLESIRWLDHIVKDISPNIRLASFLSQLVQILVNDEIKLELKNAAWHLLEDFYKERSDRTDLIQEFDAQNVPSSIRTKFNMLLGENEVMKLNSPINTFKDTQLVHANSPKPLGLASNTQESNSVSNNAQLQTFSDKLNYELDTTIEPLDVTDPEALSALFNAYTPCFEGKESEFNWKQRENSIVQIRSILRGNAATMYGDELILCLKEMALGICKAANSLRTTLSTHTCQLVKECAIILTAEFDGVADLLFPTLIKLCSNAKSITSNNANMCLSAFYANLSYTSKLIQRILAAGEERNYQPRSHACLWLQIMLLRFGSDPSFVENHGYYLIESTSKLLNKLLKDPNPNVRQVAKGCYWCFQNIFPAEAEILMKKLDTNTVKALERSKAQFQKGASQPPSSRAMSRPSLRLRQDIPPRRATPSGPRSANREEVHRANSVPLSASARVPSRQASSRVSPDLNIASSASKFSRAASWSVSHTANSGGLNRPKLRSVSVKELPKKVSTNHTEHAPNSPVEENARKSFSFSNYKDPIVDFLSSSEAAVVEEGVKLLCFAIKGNEQLPEGINQSLKETSVTYPMLLKPLFTTSEKIFNEIAKLFTPSDLLRVCCLVFPKMDEKNVRLISSAMQSNELYEVAVELLHDFSNTNTIYDTAMAVHAIDFGHVILSQVVQFISIALNIIPITDQSLKKLLTASISLVIHLKEKEGYKTLGQLLCQLYSINPNEFQTSLNQADQDTKEEVENVVGLDSMLIHDISLNKNIFELTEVRPTEAAKFVNMSPVKMPVDFTMIVPQRPQRQQQPVFQPQETISRTPSTIEVDENSKGDTEVRNTEAVVENEEEMVEEVDDNVSVDDSLRREAAGLSDDFAQVTIDDERAPPASDKMIGIQNMLEMMDPLRPLSNKAKKISIYEDITVPDEEQEENQSVDTWECTYSAKYDDHEIFMESHNWDIELFKSCCLDFAQKQNITDNALRLIRSLKLLPASSVEFHDYFINGGRYTLANCIWSYFEDLNNLNTFEIMDGLALFNQNLKYDDTIDMTRVWALLNKTCKDQQFQSEIAYIWNDILHNVSQLGNKTMEELALQCLETGDADACVRLICLNYLSKVLSQSTTLDSTKVRRIDHIFGKLLTSNQVDFRMLATVCYGSLIRNGGLAPDVRNTLNEMKSKRPVSQQKLIDMFSSQAE